MGPLSKRRGSPQTQLSTARRNQPAQRHQAEQLHPAKPKQARLRPDQDNDRPVGDGCTGQGKPENPSQKPQAEDRERKPALSKTRPATDAESLERHRPPRAKIGPVKEWS